MIPISMHDQIVAIAQHRAAPRAPLDDFDRPDTDAAEDALLSLGKRARANALVQHELLEILEAGGALTVRQVADALPYKTRPGWHWIINQLAESGHVARQHCAADDNGARLRFALTAAGRELRAELARLIRKHHPDHLEH